MTVFNNPDKALAKIQRDIQHAQTNAARALRVRHEVERVRSPG